MSAKTARALSAQRVPFDAGGYPVRLSPARPTIIVHCPDTGEWMFWDAVDNLMSNSNEAG